MDVREKLVELFYENNVMCDQKIEGLADDVIDIITNGVMAHESICPYCCDNGEVHGMLIRERLQQPAEG